MLDIVPNRARRLVHEVVEARRANKAKVLTLDEAALLREHELIDFLGRPTNKGSWTAEDYAHMGEAEDQHGHPDEGKA